MSTTSLADHAERLRALHHADAPLVLPNAWDVVSARLIEEAGFPAVASTSAGMAWALGYPDGERIPLHEMLEAVRRIARAVHSPVTADLEAGYGPLPEDVAVTTRGAIDAGAVGMNFEDGTHDDARPLFDVAAQVERIAAAREAGAERGVPIVINARTDVFLREVGAPETRLAEAVRRLQAYRDAGADCVFAPGVFDAPTIETLVREVGAPLNVLARRTTPSVAELARLGVRRISLGSGLLCAALGLTRELIARLHEDGRLDVALAAALPYAEMQSLVGGTG